jgi:hypothetical protein
MTGRARSLIVQTTSSNARFNPTKLTRHVDSDSSARSSGRPVVRKSAEDGRPQKLEMGYGIGE